MPISASVAAAAALSLMIAWCRPSFIQQANDTNQKKAVDRVEAVLDSVNVKSRRITVTLGKSIDEVLTEKLRDRTKGKPNIMPAGEKKTYALAERHVPIFIQFRSSPSVSNHVEQSLKDLDKMISYPLELETTGEGEKRVVTKITAYRGTPWKLVEPKEEKKP